MFGRSLIENVTTTGAHERPFPMEIDKAQLVQQLQVLLHVCAHRLPLLTSRARSTPLLEQIEIHN